MVSQAKSWSGFRSTASCSKISARSPRWLRGSAFRALPISNMISAMPEAADGGLGIGALGCHQPVHHDGVAVLVAEGLEDRARIVVLAEPAQAVGRAQHDAQRRGIELDGAAVLGLGRRLVARHLVDLRRRSP